MRLVIHQKLNKDFINVAPTFERDFTKAIPVSIIEKFTDISGIDSQTSDINPLNHVSDLRAFIILKHFKF